MMRICQSIIHEQAAALERPSCLRGGIDPPNSIRTVAIGAAANKQATTNKRTSSSRQKKTHDLMGSSCRISPQTENIERLCSIFVFLRSSTYYSGFIYRRHEPFLSYIYRLDPLIIIIFLSLRVCIGSLFFYLDI
jgi:hypothetical protein